MRSMWIAMAASRVGAPSRWWKRYKYFFYIAGLLMSLQLYLAYSFYSINQNEFDSYRNMKERLGKLEEHHDLDHKLGEANHVVEEKGIRNSRKAKFNGGQHRFNRSNFEMEEKMRQMAQKAKGMFIPSDMDIEHPMMGKKHPAPMYEARCLIKSKEALSALERARTDQCKKEIADTVCLFEEGGLLPKVLPRRCVLQGGNTGEYAGCFQDRADNARILPGNHAEFRRSNSPSKCINHCLRAGFAFAGVEYSYECWCGQRLPVTGKLPEKRCDAKCPGDDTGSAGKCGGQLAANIYHTGIGEKGDSTAYLVKPEDLPDNVFHVKIVFVLTVNGRALRQVRRLFKALYSTEHYYYIHVDSRQDYLYRELSMMAEPFDNVRMAQRRLSTIWGGASLLTMLMQCMEDLLQMTDWHWDYFINLSESDFPIKPLDDLVAFLTVYTGKNFVKSHGRDTPRFIRKQGLDKLFYECDTHMWRLGTRELPDGIRVDGGSDWLGLNKEFCQYVITGKDTLLTGLKTYWKYSLLPAESFFHTVLQNTEFCTTIVNNNLHLTNWRRKQGCHCQYKHIVDWCGCSPNDLKPSDMDKLLSVEGVPIFFARKFEAVISQEIIDLMEAYIFGLPNTELKPGQLAFWQSSYHHLDSRQPPSEDAFLTFYHTFANLTTQVIKQESQSDPQCHFTVHDLMEVHIYTYADTFQGLLVNYQVQSAVDHKLYSMETLMQPKRQYRVMNTLGATARLKFLEVGTNFDPKEEVFRNFGNLIGPFSEVTLMHSWGEGEEFKATIAFIDPSNVVAASYDLTVKAGEYVGTHKPEFSYPRRPGRWTVKLLYMWEQVAEAQFLVTPLAFYNGQPMDAQTAQAIHNGPKGLYLNRDFGQFASMLKLPDTEAAAKAAHENSLKTGSDLQGWIETLIGEVWSVAESCIEEDGTSSVCQHLPECKMTKWSSKYPDPKSELGKINAETGRFR